uniref:Uncharacterized protein n=1 Tax=Anguilla anguilla TaxID=7936 RepID=A0A0E9TP02_ANGAN
MTSEGKLLQFPILLSLSAPTDYNSTSGT